MRKLTNLVSPSACLVVILGFDPLVLAGDIKPPPGPIGPTMKTLTEVEPRTPIMSVPFTISESDNGTAAFEPWIDPMLTDSRTNMNRSNRKLESRRDSNGHSQGVEG